MVWSPLCRWEVGTGPESITEVVQNCRIAAWPHQTTLLKDVSLGLACSLPAPNSVSSAPSLPEGFQDSIFFPRQTSTGRIQSYSTGGRAGPGQARQAGQAGASGPWLGQNQGGMAVEPSSRLTALVLVPCRLPRSSLGCLLPEESLQVKRGWSPRGK